MKYCTCFKDKNEFMTFQNTYDQNVYVDTREEESKNKGYNKLINI